MADARFFQPPAPQTLATIAARVGGQLAKADDSGFQVVDVASLSSAGPAHLSFLDNKKYRDQFSSTKAGAVIIHPDAVSYAPSSARLIVSPNPYKSYALAAQIFYPEEWPASEISEFARIHHGAKIGKDVCIGDFAIISDKAEIGDGCWIEPHAVIGKGVVIGKGCRIGVHANVSHAVIGNKVRLYTGARIGQDGFGFAIDPTGFVKVPQLGCVVIGDGVEIGANTTIDRGTSGDTVIGAGTWIDNLVQIAHNVKIGKGCVLVAQVGIAGSTEIGDFVVMGGQVGVAGHLKVGSMAKIAAKSGVTKNVPPYEEWMGYPAMPMKKFLRQTVKLGQLTEKQKEEN